VIILILMFSVYSFLTWQLWYLEVNTWQLLK